MTRIPFLLFLASILSAFGAQAAEPQESPFACNRLALTPEQRTRHFDELGPKLRSLRKDVRELPNGYEFEFPSDPATVQLVAEWAAGERACCPFFDIEMRLEREGGPFWLRLTGREGVKQFIRVDGAAGSKDRRPEGGWTASPLILGASFKLRWGEDSEKAARDPGGFSTLERSTQRPALLPAGTARRSFLRKPMAPLIPWVADTSPARRDDGSSGCS